MPPLNDDANDGEIIDIFVEEADEVLQNIDRDLAAWRQRPTDKNALTGIRRAFHTLKGSGRMVKALDLGELAWKVENMLNRALDGTVPVTDSMVQLVAASRRAMPKLVEAFKSRRQAGITDELEHLMSQADAIAAGQTTATPAPRPAPVAAGDQIQVRLSELQRTLERSGQRADEALQRSEMALQQVRRLAAEVGAMQADAQDRAGRADLALIAGRLNALGGELAELRLALRKAPTEGAPHPRELAVHRPTHPGQAQSWSASGARGTQARRVRRTAASARNLAIWSILVALAILADCGRRTASIV
jgi:chemotaxis protein histidine kinase CheA